MEWGEGISAYLDIFSEVHDGSARVLIIRPLCAINSDFPRIVVTMQRSLRKVLYFVHVSLANCFALSPVVQIIARDGRGDTDEDEPIPRGQFGTFGKPRLGNTGVLQCSLYAGFLDLGRGGSRAIGGHWLDHVAEVLSPVPSTECGAGGDFQSHDTGSGKVLCGKPYSF